MYPLGAKFYFRREDRPWNGLLSFVTWFSSWHWWPLFFLIGEIKKERKSIMSPSKMAKLSLLQDASSIPLNFCPSAMLAGFSCYNFLMSYLIDSHCHLHDREFFSEKQAEEMLLKKYGTKALPGKDALKKVTKKSIKSTRKTTSRKA